MQRTTAFVSTAPLRASILTALRPFPAQQQRRPAHPASPARRAPRAALGPLVALEPLDAALSTITPLPLADVSAVNYNSLAVTALVFVLTFWGGISFVKGSIKPRITQASFSLPVPAADVAKTVSKYLMARGFKPDNNKDPRPGVVTFEGNVRASSSVAAILVAVGASGLWAGSLILNVLLPENLKSDYWGLIALASFAVVPWYKGQAARVEEVKVMVEEKEPSDGGSAETKSVLFLKAHRDEILTLEEALSWQRNDPDGEEAAAVVAAAAARAGRVESPSI
jgi:Cofactor assembly of complex C subunit B